MEIIKRRQRVEHVSYNLFFQRSDDSYGSGYAFPCDEHGAVFGDEHRAAEQRREQVTALLFGLDGGYDAPRIERRAHAYNEPAVGLCQCGTEVALCGFTNTCDGCERDYNWGGQLLAPRSQWGEETGETAADILTGGDPWGAD